MVSLSSDEDEATSIDACGSFCADAGSDNSDIIGFELHRSQGSRSCNCLADSSLGVHSSERKLFTSSDDVWSACFAFSTGSHIEDCNSKGCGAIDLTSGPRLCSTGCSSGFGYCPKFTRKCSDCVDMSKYANLGAGLCGDRDGNAYEFGTLDISQASEAECAMKCEQISTDGLVGFHFDDDYCSCL